MAVQLVCWMLCLKLIKLILFPSYLLANRFPPPRKSILAHILPEVSLNFDLADAFEVTEGLFSDRLLSDIVDPKLDVDFLLSFGLKIFLDP